MKNNKRFFLIAGGVIVVLAVSYGFYLTYVSLMISLKEQQSYLNSNQDVIINTPSERNTNVNETGGGQLQPDYENRIAYENVDFSVSETIESIDTRNLTVQWKYVAQQVDYEDFFDKENVLEILKDNTILQYHFLEPESYLKNNFRIHNVGQVLDYQVFVVTYNEPVEGPAFDTSSVFRVIKKDNGPIILAQQSANLIAPLDLLFKVNKVTKIDNLEPPKEISIPDSNIKLIRDDNIDTGVVIKNSEDELFQYDDNHYVYKNIHLNCHYALAGDSTSRTYYYDLEFINDNKQGNDIFGYTAQNLNFTFLDGTPNKAEYFSKRMGGCGPSGCYNFPSYINDISQLEKIGQTTKNGPIYELNDFTVKAYKKAERSVIDDMYLSYYPGIDENNDLLERISFEEFLEDYPILYWQDPFGEFIEFRNAKYTPATECGKPVIYLYPQQEMDINVYVNPTGGFKFTEPLYNNGWNVRANPISQIYNYSDEQIYPYLFWEGYVLNYSIPNEGFVVEATDVQVFLKAKLKFLGLYEHEINDFFEFWLPRMQDKPYYFITFVPQEKFEQMAPLKVSPQPDSIIRVFMDYKGLDYPIKIKPQKLEPQTRHGYSVIEWGGEMLP